MSAFIYSTPGIIKIKNVSGGPYVIEELAGHVIADNEEIDICDSGLPEYYEGFIPAKRLVTEITSAKLYQDIQAGNIQIIEMTSPIE